MNVSKIKQKDTIESLAKKSKIGVEEIEKIGLNPNDKIGYTKDHIALAFRGKSRGKKPTEKQIERLAELGISLEKRLEQTQEFIEKLKKLKKIGVDVSKIVRRDTIKSLAKKSKIEVEEIEKIGLNPDYKIGYTKERIARTFRGVKGKNPTEEQVKDLTELGISLEYKNENYKKRTGKEIAEASISSLTDIEMADRENMALSTLVEETKEGGIKAI